MKNKKLNEVLVEWNKDVKQDQDNEIISNEQVLKGFGIPGVIQYDWFEWPIFNGQANKKLLYPIHEYNVWKAFKYYSEKYDIEKFLQEFIDESLEPIKKLQDACSYDLGILNLYSNIENFLKMFKYKKASKDYQDPASEFKRYNYIDIKVCKFLNELFKNQEVREIFSNIDEENDVYTFCISGRNNLTLDIKKPYISDDILETISSAVKDVASKYGLLYKERSVSHQYFIWISMPVTQSPNLN